VHVPPTFASTDFGGLPPEARALSDELFAWDGDSPPAP